MKESFEKLMDVIEKNDKFCVWIQQHNVANYLQKIKDEVEEVSAGIEKGDGANVVEEVSDVLYNILVLVKLAEKEYGVNIKQMMDNIIEKLKRRKPYIFEERSVTMEEATKLWKEAKDKENKND